MGNDGGECHDEGTFADIFGSPKEINFTMRDLRNLGF